MEQEKTREEEIKMNKRIQKKSVGVIILSVLFFLGAVVTGVIDYDNFTLMYRPKFCIYFWFWLSKWLAIIGGITAVGLVLFKNFCRKTAIVLLAIDLARIIIEAPFLIIPNVDILGGILNIVFDLTVIYFFTRPMVRMQFK